MEEAFFHVIASSSSGNCAFLRAGGVNALIDAGISASRIREALRQYGASLGDIDAIFITHEHSDHCCALETLSKYPQITVFANESTYEIITAKKPGTRALSWKVFTSGQSFRFRGLKVSSYPVPHDASDTVAYRIEACGKSVVWLTDLGKPTILARDAAKSANILVLESNYCPLMLERSQRPMRLKARISGSHGHLSNADAISILRDLDCSVVEKIFLAHVSKECNDVRHIAELLAPLPGPILSKIEIVNPFEGCRMRYGWSAGAREDGGQMRLF